MASMEERMSAVERALRLQDRERSVQRALFTTAMSDIHLRIDDLTLKVDGVSQRLDAVQADVSAMQADVSAILRLLNQKFPPG